MTEGEERKGKEECYNCQRTHLTRSPRIMIYYYLMHHRELSHVNKVILGSWKQSTKGKEKWKNEEGFWVKRLGEREGGRRGGEDGC